MTDITMPQLGETVTEGTITKWHKAVGDSVKEDEVLYEVSTDKVDTEVTAPTSGFLAEIVVPEGETVDVGTKLATIAPEGAAVQAAPAEETPEPATQQAAAEASEASPAETVAPTAEAPAATPQAAPAPAQTPAPAEAPAPAEVSGNG